MKIIAVLAALICIATGTGISSAMNTETPLAANDIKNTAVYEETAETEMTLSVEIKSSDKSGKKAKNYKYSKKSVQETSVAEVTEPETENETQPESTTAEITVPEQVYTENTVTENEVCEEVSEETAEVEYTEEAETAEYFEYKVLYKELLDELRFETEDISVVKYILLDMENDDVPELVTVTGTCEADMITTFYTIKDHQVVAAKETFRGDHCAFYNDNRRNILVIRNDWGGTGSITGYIFSGEDVFDAYGIKDYDYMADPEGYEQAVSDMFDLSSIAYGEAYSDGQSILVTPDFSRVELGSDSYYFTE